MKVSNDIRLDRLNKWKKIALKFILFSVGEFLEFPSRKISTDAHNTNSTGGRYAFFLPSTLRSACPRIVERVSRRRKVRALRAESRNTDGDSFLNGLSDEERSSWHVAFLCYKIRCCIRYVT